MRVLSSGSDPHPIRLESVSTAIREGYPDGDIFESLALIITELGEDPAIILILAVMYWLVERENTAALASFVAVGVGFTLFIKTMLAMPRPPEEVWLVVRDYDPHGFPSGHAFNAVVIYGGFLYLFDRLRDPLSVAGGVGLIVAIALSRVVLGFHYFGDILVGAMLGVVFVLLMDTITQRDPARGFALGVVVAIPAIIVSDADPFSLIGLGASIGGLIGTYDLDAIPELQSRVEAAILTVGGFAFLVVVTLLLETIAPHNPVAIVVAHVAIIGGIFLAPLGASHVETQRRRVMAADEPG